MSKLVKLSTLAGVLALPATAYAHDGDHSASVLANIGHWLSSPTHSLFAGVSGVAISAIIIHFARKRRA